MCIWNLEIPRKEVERGYSNTKDHLSSEWTSYQTSLRSTLRCSLLIIGRKKDDQSCNLSIPWRKKMKREKKRKASKYKAMSMHVNASMSVNEEVFKRQIESKINENAWKILKTSSWLRHQMCCFEFSHQRELHEISPGLVIVEDAFSSMDHGEVTTKHHGEDEGVSRYVRRSTLIFYPHNDIPA